MLDLDIPALTVAEADAYHASRGNQAWLDAPSSPPDTKQAAIARGQDYVAGRYNSRFAVEFEPDDVPVAVQYAVAEAARLELATPGVLAPVLQRGGQLRRLRERVEGAVEREQEWAASAPVQATVSAIENILRAAGMIRSGAKPLMRV